MNRPRRARSAAGFFLGLCLACSSAFAGYNEGREAYQKKDYATALAEFGAAAAQGHAQSMLVLGIMYRQGLGVPQDIAQSLQWFTRAAELNLADAQAELGRIYAAGDGVKVDLAVARKWYGAAAEQGHPRGLYGLGTLHRLGAGGEADPVKAMELYRKAAARAYVPAYLEIGFLYEQGMGVARDLDEAISWYERARQAGDQTAQARISRVQAAKTAQAPRPPTAPVVAPQAAIASPAASKALIERANAGASQAQYQLGLAYERGAGVDRSDTAAIDWFGKAAQQGYAPAQVSLGRKYLGGVGVPRNAEIAAGWFARAAEQGNTEGQYFLGTLQMDGQGVFRDPPRGLEMLQRAAERNHLDAAVRAARALASGEVGPRRIDEAVALLKRVEGGLDRADRRELAKALYSIEEPLATRFGRLYFSLDGNLLVVESQRDPASMRLQETARRLNQPAAPFDAGALDALVEQQRYVDAVIKLRQSKSSVDAARWLKNKAAEGHPPLQLEFALWLSAADTEEALTWFFTGLAAVVDDTAVCSDRLARATVARLLVRYTSLSRLVDRRPDRARAALERSFAALDAQQRQHSPGWACYGPFDILVANAPPRLLPETAWLEERRTARDALLRAIERGISVITKDAQT